MTTYRLLFSLPGKLKAEVWRKKNTYVFCIVCPQKLQSYRNSIHSGGLWKPFQRHVCATLPKKEKRKTPSPWFLSILWEVTGACSACDDRGLVQSSMHHLRLWCWTELRGGNVSASLGLLVIIRNIDWGDDRVRLVQVLILESLCPSLSKSWLPARLVNTLPRPGQIKEWKTFLSKA